MQIAVASATFSFRIYILEWMTLRVLPLERRYRLPCVVTSVFDFAMVDGGIAFEMINPVVGITNYPRFLIIMVSDVGRNPHLTSRLYSGLEFESEDRISFHTSTLSVKTLKKHL